MSCFLQDDLKKFVSEPPPPPQEVEIPKEGKTKAKEWREVGEGDDTIVVEDTSDEDDDEEMLWDHFQLRSRFSRPSLPHVPLIQDQPASLEASLAAPPRRPRNASRKRVAKKLKVTETTSQEVSRLHLCGRVLVSRVDVLTVELPCLQELPPTEPVDQSDEGEWDTVGEATGSCSPAPTVEELLVQLERQPPAMQESTEPAAAAVKEVVAAEAQRRHPPRVDWWTSLASSTPRP
jgi:hypothetical protein